MVGYLLNHPSNTILAIVINAVMLKYAVVDTRDGKKYFNINIVNISDFHGQHRFLFDVLIDKFSTFIFLKNKNKY